MKKEGSLKLILAILVTILLCLVSVCGIYVKDRNVMKNWLPDYVLGKDLDTNTVIKLNVDKKEETSSDDTSEESSENEENKDGTENGETTENNEGSTDGNANNQENSSEGQAENIYTLDNYKKSKKIIEKRLKLAGVPQYNVKLEEQTGSIIIEVPNNVDSTIIQNSFSNGKTEIKIEETGEVIGDNKSIKNFGTSIDDTYASSGIGSNVKIDVQFTKDAVKKFKEIKNSYVIPTDEKGEKKENNIQITIDGNSMVSLTETEFLEAAVNGNLQLYGNYTTDPEALKESLNSINSQKMLIQTDNLPVAYTVEYQVDEHSNINQFGVISVFIVILGVMFIYLIFKYKSKGLLAGLSILGFGSLLLLLLRYTRVEISIATIVAIAGTLVLQFMYLIKVLNNKNITSKQFTEETIEYSKMLIPLLILSICVAVLPALESSKIIPFGNIQEISNFGMVGFWGVIIFEIFNNILTRTILTNVKNK